MEKLLEIKALWVQYTTELETVNAVNGISLSLNRGENLGLVGETGAGKTTTALSVMQLIPEPPGEIVSGEIFYEGRNLLEMSESEKRKIRGNEISMIFQDPMTALNPVYTIGFQIAETIKNHERLNDEQANEKAKEMLRIVGIEPTRFDDYPHQFSGGMKQRAVIAIALACNPTLLIADEPTTALDVTIQAQVLELMNRLRAQYNTSMIMITHDLGIIAETCDKVAIMYAGEVIEYGALEAIFNRTQHPYTKGLFDSIPSLEKDVDRLNPIKGLIPDPTDLPLGCAFHPRCPYVQAKCRTEKPRMSGKGHSVKCHFPLQEEVVR